MVYYSMVGVDPGLVHTGIVALHLDTEARTHEVDYRIIQGEPMPDKAAARSRVLIDNTALVRTAVDEFLGMGEMHGFIEKYVDRGTVFQTHGPMREFEHLLKDALPGFKIIDNMGSKQIAVPPLMKAFHLNTFPTTNHRDLQAAARILMFGALKDDELNKVLTEYMIDFVDGNPWKTA